MARLELYVQWDVYDENEERLKEGDTVKVSLGGEVVYGRITELYCMLEEEAAYIEFQPMEEDDTEESEIFYKLRDVAEFDSIEKIG